MLQMKLAVNGLPSGLESKKQGDKGGFRPLRSFVVLGERTFTQQNLCTVLMLTVSNSY